MGDYGDIATITASTALLGVSTAQDLGFSSPRGPTGPADVTVAQQGGTGTGTPEVPTVAGGGPESASDGLDGDATPDGSGGGEASGGQAGDDGGGALPFTGLAAGALAVTGGALSAAGHAVRKVARRRGSQG